MEILLLLLFLLLIYAVAGIVLFGEDVINRAELERLGFTRAECDWKANLIRKNVTCVVLLASVALGLSARLSADASPPRPSPPRAALAGASCAAMVCAWYSDAVLSPPALEGSPSLAVQRAIGPWAYFTRQALGIQLVYTGLGAAAEAALLLAPPPPLAARALAACHLAAPLVASIGMALTVLYLRLNWFEPSWRREVLEPLQARGVPFRRITLTAHLTSLPVAALDLALARRPALLAARALSTRGTALTMAAYAAAYIAVTRLNHRATGHYPYPFMKLLASHLHWLAFMLALLLALMLVLALASLLVWANPTGDA